MKITAVKATPVAVPFSQPEAWAYGERQGMVSVIVEVETDGGITGIGEAAAYPSSAIICSVLDSTRDLVLGESPFNVQRIMNKVHIVGTWHHVQATSPAIAAIEMACWDIIGKASEQPIVNLFGGRIRDEVEYFYYLGRKSADEMAKDAEAGRDAGFKTFYMKACGDDPADDIERVEALRAAIGPDGRIRVDANEAWSVAATIRIVRELNRFDLELIEQPVSGRNLSEMAFVRGRIDVPLLANEASWTRYHQLSIIQAGAADAVSVDNQMDGGLTNLKVGGEMCAVAGLPVLKHSLGELGVATYAGAHILATLPNAIYASQAYGSLLADDILKGTGSLPYRNGSLAVPEAPGIGVELDADKVGKYADAFNASPEGYSFRNSGSLANTPVMPKF